MKVEIEIPDSIQPLIERLRATKLYSGDDSMIVGQLAIRSLRDIFEKRLIAEQANTEVPPASLHAGDGAPLTDDQERDDAERGEEGESPHFQTVKSSHGADIPVQDPEEVAAIVRRLSAEETPSPRLTVVQEGLLRVIRDAEGIRLSHDEMARRCRIARGSIGYNLAKLEAYGLIENVGHGRSPHWIAKGYEPVETKRTMSPRGSAPARRFTAPKELDPENVRGLAADHPAVTEGRTLFPTTVVDPADSERLLVSGRNSSKIGDKVSKGPWAGMPIYTLTLEERASCPTSCHVWKECFGNGMPMARRHRHGDELIDFLRGELTDLQNEHPDGFVVRLHVLGDFWSVDYVAAWAGFLRTFPALRVFGYTAHERGSEIGAAIKRVTDTQWNRFAIRFSSKQSKPQGATTIFRMAEADNVPEGTVCPMQTAKTDCCGTCGLCWHPAAKEKTIVFMAHGRVGAKPGPRKYAPKPNAPRISPSELSREHAKAFKPVAKPMTSENPIVQEWLDRHGGPRTFEPGASLEVYNLRQFLKDRGIEVQQKGLGNKSVYIVGKKKLGYLGLLALVNEHRVKAGLEPLTIEASGAA